MSWYPLPLPFTSNAFILMFLVPEKALWKVKARLRVSVFPALLTLDPGPLKEQRLFDADPDPLGANPPSQELVASFHKYKRLLWPW